MESSIVFIDTEVSVDDDKAYDYGAVDSIGRSIHTGSAHAFEVFIAYKKYVCGHNIINHDSRYINIAKQVQLIDTLYLSPLLFPNKPYHALLKDDKLLSDELNNPLNDSIKAKNLFYDEVNAFNALDNELKEIYYLLLKDNPYFSGFWSFMNFSSRNDVRSLILSRFKGKICSNSPIGEMIEKMPTELAFCLALTSATEEHSLIPRWVQMNYPNVDTVIRKLRNTPCHECDYCKEKLNPIFYLKKYFGYEKFRKFGDEPLQENAVNSALNHNSLLCIFPTGGGKSLTFQIPALMSGETERGLTVVISPLQSLMKDQVDNLEKKGIEGAVTINGLLSPVERAEAIERVASGMASILYISPESLRSATIERLFLSRHITRFVIDEAHCFSAWGQDFRVDYLYIGDFIRELQEKKGEDCRIPVSCFTATAKQKVISDIKDYFKQKLDLDFELFATNASRTNLRYEVLYKETDGEKYETMRNLIEIKKCPTIVYVSRTKRTFDLANKLNSDGFKARPFNGKMESSEKQANQEAFINDEVQIIVATSAFGMGVDKSNVKLVIHYDISDSLENYVQEAGRAGRDQSLQAECYVLFNDGDLDKHFILLNQTKLSISEIQQVWRAIKNLTKTNNNICSSPLEIARGAGWDDSVPDVETRVKTAIQALENSGYIKRGKNVPHVYADSIRVKSMIEAGKRIDESHRFETDDERTVAKRIISSLITSKSVVKAHNREAKSRVDYLADTLGLEKADVIDAIQKMREDGILSDSKDLTAYIKKSDTENKSLLILKKYQALEVFLLQYLEENGICLNYKEINDKALSDGIKSSSVNAIKTLFYFWTIRSYIEKEQDLYTNSVSVNLKYDIQDMKSKREKSYDVAEFIVRYLYENSSFDINEKEETLVAFSLIEIRDAYKNSKLFDVQTSDITEALLFLSKISAIKLEGGFLVLYNGMKITRLITDNKIMYKKDDYKQLDEFYKLKIQQIHIVGEYANMMVRDYNSALAFVNDYFQMDYKKFISTYFKGERAAQIEKNITPEKYRQLFDTLSERQLEIIRDNESKYIVCTAGPGSGKTRVLVHKLASLLLLEDVKHEQLLMLTFSRAAAIEFKSRLYDLIGNAATFVEVKTFHSYCFDLLGKIGSLEESENVVEDAGRLILSEDVDLGKITKTVLVIDEAQDMDEHEFALVRALMERNDEMRVIAVGDDDQNIYEFRGSDSKYLKSFITDYNAKQYSLIDNYRSCKSVVDFANAFAKGITERLKTEEIRAVSENVGEVKLIKHSGEYIESALVDDIASLNGEGTTCVLTNTNQEALIVLGALKQRGIRAKLIQTIGDINIYNIAEIRFFIKCVDIDDKTAIISDESWKDAVGKLKRYYGDSECLSLILDILNAFERNNKKKYCSDFKIFLQESRIEDFYKTEQGVVTVSTMHKSKGREFDNVFMLLNDPDISTDESRRKHYVAITRAKSLLHIHYTGNEFDAFSEYATEFVVDNEIYKEPSEITMQLSHRDVFLDFFKDKKKQILSLKSGCPLTVKANKLCYERDGKSYPLVQLSSKSYAEVKSLKDLGYMPYSAKIRFVVAWKGKDDDEETAVILPSIEFRKELSD
ncbi:MAG: RecQ family ATP-dependent DNA helicase [Oscillospiraceae bacterium]